ncbi:unnamed protein product [Closterium sp. NIES-53]
MELSSETRTASTVPVPRVFNTPVHSERPDALDSDSEHESLGDGADENALDSNSEKESTSDGADENFHEVEVQQVDRVSRRASEASSTPGQRMRQTRLSWSGPHLPPRKRSRKVSTVDDKVAPAVNNPAERMDVPASEKKLVEKWNPGWKQNFKWLVLEYDDEQQMYGMKCKICKAHAKNNKSPFGPHGIGARDFQVGCCRGHEFSRLHLAAVTADHIAKGTERQHRSILELLSTEPLTRRVVKCLQAAYWCCRNDAPIMLYTLLVKFMAEQGCPDMTSEEAYGRYYSRYACGEFVSALASYLQGRQLVDVQASPWYGLSFDESTDRAHGKHMIMYVHFERNEQTEVQFFGNIPFDKADGASLYASITAHLGSKGLSLDKLAGVSSDGAKVMVGTKKGVVGRLMQRCPWLVAVHCVAHREALAANDAAKKFPDFNVIDSQIRKTAEHIGRSSISRDAFMQLQDVVMKTQLEVQGIFDVRWLSRGDAVARFCVVLPILLWLWHDEDQAAYKTGTSFKFQFMLFFLADVLEMLNTLNMAFQRLVVSLHHVMAFADTSALY